jgi:hypothetical protein
LLSALLLAPIRFLLHHAEPKINCLPSFHELFTNFIFFAGTLKTFIQGRKKEEEEEIQ